MNVNKNLIGLGTITCPRAPYATENPANQAPAAGVTSKFNESAKDCLSWSERPRTPDEQRKYRQSTWNEPGKIVKHFGAADDSLPDKVYGAKCASGESAGDVVKCYPESEIAQWKQQRAEDIYASTKREPLGQGYVRGHNIPEHLGVHVPFGKATEVAGKPTYETNAGPLIFPVDNPIDDDAEARRLYLASHKTYAPGEQRTRGYNWDRTGVDPARHAFGARDKDNYRDGVAKALNPQLDDGIEKATKIVAKKLEDFKISNADILGQPKVLGAVPSSAQDRVFGAPSLRRPEARVGDLIGGFYTPAEQQPDADLGKSLREGWRNTAPQDKVFGAPSIRTDIVAPKAKSVANTVNYGNEPDASQLLRPPQSTDRGVCEEHYMQLRSKTELKQIVEDAGIAVSSAEFDDLFATCVEVDCQTDKCCLDTFMKVRHGLMARNAAMNMPYRL